MAWAERIDVEIGLNSRDFNKKLDKAIGNMNRFSTTVSKQSKKAFSVMAASAALAGVAVAKFGVTAVEAGAKFENAMYTLGSIRGIDPLTGSLKGAEDQARSLGQSTLFTATQAAEGMQKLARAGMSMADIIATSGTALEFAGANFISMNQSTTLVAATMKQFSIAAQDATRITDVMTTAAQNSLYNIEGLATSMRYGGSAGSSLGASLEETVAMLAQFRNLGLESSMAGVRFRQSMLALSAPTYKAKKALAALNIPLEEVNPRVVGLEQAFLRLGKAGLTADQLVPIVNKISAADVAKISSQLHDASTAVGDLGENSKETITPVQDLMNKMSEMRGVTKKTYDMIKASTVGQFQILQSAFQELQITLFDALKGGPTGTEEQFASIKHVIQGLKSVVDDLIRAFKISLNEIGKSTGAIFGDVANKLKSNSEVIAATLVKNVLHAMSFAKALYDWISVIATITKLLAVMFASFSIVSMTAAVYGFIKALILLAGTATTASLAFHTLAASLAEAQLALLGPLGIVAALGLFIGAMGGIEIASRAAADKTDLLTQKIVAQKTAYTEFTKVLEEYLNQVSNVEQRVGIKAISDELDVRGELNVSLKTTLDNLRNLTEEQKQAAPEKYFNTQIMAGGKLYDVVLDLVAARKLQETSLDEVVGAENIAALSTERFASSVDKATGDIRFGSTELKSAQISLKDYSDTMEGGTQGVQKFTTEMKDGIKVFKDLGGSSTEIEGASIAFAETLKKQGIAVSNLADDYSGELNPQLMNMRGIEADILAESDKKIENINRYQNANTSLKDALQDVVTKSKEYAELPDPGFLDSVSESESGAKRLLIGEIEEDLKDLQELLNDLGEADIITIPEIPQIDLTAWHDVKGIIGTVTDTDDLDNFISVLNTQLEPSFVNIQSSTAHWIQLNQKWHDALMGMLDIDVTPVSEGIRKVGAEADSAANKLKSLLDKLEKLKDKRIQIIISLQQEVAELIDPSEAGIAEAQQSAKVFKDLQKEEIKVINDLLKLGKVSSKRRVEVYRDGRLAMKLIAAAFNQKMINLAKAKEKEILEIEQDASDKVVDILRNKADRELQISEDKHKKELSGLLEAITQEEKQALESFKKLKSRSSQLFDSIGMPPPKSDWGEAVRKSLRKTGKVTKEQQSLLDAHAKKWSELSEEERENAKALTEVDLAADETAKALRDALTAAGPAKLTEEVQELSEAWKNASIEERAFAEEVAKGVEWSPPNVDDLSIADGSFVVEMPEMNTDEFTAKFGGFVNEATQNHARFVDTINKTGFNEAEYTLNNYVNNFITAQKLLEGKFETKAIAVDSEAYTTANQALNDYVGKHTAAKQTIDARELKSTQLLMSEEGIKQHHQQKAGEATLEHDKRMGEEKVRINRGTTVELNGIIDERIEKLTTSAGQEQAALTQLVDWKDNQFDHLNDIIKAAEDHGIDITAKAAQAKLLIEQQYAAERTAIVGKMYADLGIAETEGGAQFVQGLQDSQDKLIGILKGSGALSVLAGMGIALFVALKKNQTELINSEMDFYEERIKIQLDYNRRKNDIAKMFPDGGADFDKLMEQTERLRTLGEAQAENDKAKMLTDTRFYKLTMKALGAYIKAWKGGIGKIFEGFKFLAKPLEGALSGMIGAAKDKFPKLAGIIGNVKERVGESVGKIAGKFGELGPKIAATLGKISVKGFMVVLGAMVGAAGAAFKGIASAASMVGKAIMKIAEMTNQAISFMTGGFSLNLLDMMQGGANAILEDSENAAARLKELDDELAAGTITQGEYDEARAEGVGTANPEAAATQFVDDAVNKALKFVDAIVTAAPIVVQRLIDKLPELLSAIVAGIPVVLTALLQGIGPVITSVVNMLIALIPELVNVIVTELPNLVTTLIFLITDKLPDIIDALVTGLTSIFDTLFAPLSGENIDDLKAALAEGKISEEEFAKQSQTLFDTLVEAIVAGALKIIEGIGDLVVHLVKAVPGIVQSIVTALPELIEGLLAGANKLIEAVLQALPDLLMFILMALPGLILVLLKGVLDLIVIIAKEVPMLVAKIIEALPDLIEEILAMAVLLIVAIIEAVPQVVLALISTLPALIKALVTLVPDVIQVLIMHLLTAIPTIVAVLITDILFKLPEIVYELIAGIIEGIGGALEGVVESIREVWTLDGEFWEPLRKMWDDVIERIKDALPGGFQDTPDEELTDSQVYFKKMGRFIGDTWNELTSGGDAETETWGDTPGPILAGTDGLAARFQAGDYVIAAQEPLNVASQALELLGRSTHGALRGAVATAITPLVSPIASTDSATRTQNLNIAVIAEGRVLDDIQVRAINSGKAPKMKRKLRAASGVIVGFNRGKYNNY